MARPYPCIPFYSLTFSGFFASSLAIIRLNKLTTLSLRDIPPLKPFERRDQSTDIHDDMGRTQDPPLLTSSQYTRNIRFTRNIRLYRDISFDMHRSPCRPKQSAGHTGGSGGQSPTEGVLFPLLHRSPCRQERSEGRTGGAGRAFARTEGVLTPIPLLTKVKRRSIGGAGGQSPTEGGLLPSLFCITPLANEMKSKKVSAKTMT